MAKKISYLLIGLVFILTFWFIMGAKYTYNDESNAFSKLQCVSYAPYGKNQSPFDKDYQLDEDLVRKDLQLLAQYTDCIRTYASVGLEIIPQIARENNLKMYMGAWVNADPEFTKKELDTLVQLAKDNADIIKGVIVGNEVLLRKEISEQQLFNYIKSVKDQLPNIKVTYADVWEFWLKHPSIKNTTDFVTIHILPYWEDEPQAIEDAIKHLEKVRLDVEKVLGSDKILIGETGWPSEGRMREEAFPSKINQAKFVREFVTIANKYNWNYNIIEAFDQPWKRISEGAVGGFWGLFDADRNDKYVFKGEVSNFPNYMYLILTSVLLFGIFSTLILKQEATRKQTIQFSLVNTIFAILFTLQLEQFFITVRNSIEFIWATGVLALHGYLYFFVLVNILSQKKNLLPTALLYVISSFVTVTSLYLAFDGRYQNFEIYAYLISAISLVYIYINKLGELKLSSFAKILSIVLVISSVVILINEKITNIYSNIWILIILIYAFILYSGSKAISFNEIKKILIFIFVVFLVFFAIEYSMISNNDVGTYCNINKEATFCQIRQNISYLLYIKILGIGALFFVVVASIRKKVSYYWIALFLGVAGIAMHNVFFGSIAFIISLYFLMNNNENNKNLI